MAQYATAYPDSRTRGKISLNNSTFVRSPKSSGSVIPTDLLLSLVLSKSLLAIALYITKEWLMSTGIPTLGIWSGYLILGAPMVLLFQKPWVKGSSKGQVRFIEIVVYVPLNTRTEYQFTPLLALLRRRDAFLFYGTL